MTRLQTGCHFWLRSCTMAWHNTGCGERELRGERRSKDGRSLLAAAAPSFFIPFVFLFSGLSAQRIELYGAISGALSTDIASDAVATATLRQVLGGGVDREVTARPGLSPSFGLGVSIPVRQRAAVEVEAGWTPARLEVTEDGRTRDVQAMNLIEGSLGASWSLQDGLEVGGAAGVLAYTADRTGLFAEGGTISPALRGHLGLRRPFWDGRVSLRGSAQIHRFGTAAIRLVGGSDGFVTRFQAGVRVRFR